MLQLLRLCLRKALLLQLLILKLVLLVLFRASVSPRDADALCERLGRARLLRTRRLRRAQVRSRSDRNVEGCAHV